MPASVGCCFLFTRALNRCLLFVVATVGQSRLTWHGGPAGATCISRCPEWQSNIPWDNLRDDGDDDDDNDDCRCSFFLPYLENFKYLISYFIIFFCSTWNTLFPLSSVQKTEAALQQAQYWSSATLKKIQTTLNIKIKCIKTPYFKTHSFVLDVLIDIWSYTRTA